MGLNNTLGNSVCLTHFKKLSRSALEEQHHFYNILKYASQQSWSLDRLCACRMGK